MIKDNTFPVDFHYIFKKHALSRFQTLLVSTPWSTVDIPLIVTKTESNVGISMQFNLI